MADHATPPLVPALRVRARRGLTVIELAVVVGVLAILALITFPFLHTATTRAKVAAARANQRTLSGALEAYHVDHNTFPSAAPLPPHDIFGILANYQLRGLTTPVAYAAPAVFRDPFGIVRAQSQASIMSPPGGGAGGPHIGDRPVPTLPNPEQSQLYVHYPSFAQLTANPALRSDGLGLISLGPDLEDSFGAFYPFPEALPPLAATYGFVTSRDTLYDPTNGTYSRGDIPRYVQVAGTEAAP